jgi:hypothetical protein
VTISRSRLVDTTVSRWYHCISRCVRRAHLLGDEATPGRKDWIENRLKELDQIFAVSVGGFSLMDNHLHLLLRIDPEVANGWSDSEVVERWFRLFPPRGSDRKPLEDRRGLGAVREGIRSGFTLGQYVMLVEYTGRMLR